MEPMEWLFVTAAITLLFVVFAVSPMQAAIDEAVESNAYLQVRRIASVINLVSSGPDGMTYMLDMPGKKCNLLITQDFVKLVSEGVKPSREIYGLIMPSAVPHNFQFDCASGTLKITKIGGVLNFEG